jgi:hypothetical protein
MSGVIVNAKQSETSQLSRSTVGNSLSSIPVRVAFLPRLPRGHRNVSS